MFYSQYILTKKGPLAKIWLAAHMQNKLTKAMVFSTDVRVTCEKIIHPDAPMALRLTSNLMLGVVRIYSRKAKYLLADCSEAVAKLRTAFRSGKGSFPEAGEGDENIDIEVAPYGKITLEMSAQRTDIDLDPAHGFLRLDEDVHMSIEPMLQISPSNAFQASAQDITMDRFRIGGSTPEDELEGLEVELPRRQSPDERRLPGTDLGVAGDEEDEDVIAFTPVAKLSQERQKRRLSQAFGEETEQPDTSQLRQLDFDQPEIEISIPDIEAPEITRREEGLPATIQGVDVGPVTPTGLVTTLESARAEGLEAAVVEMPTVPGSVGRTSDFSPGVLTPLSRVGAEEAGFSIPTPEPLHGRPFQKRRKHLTHDEGTTLTAHQIRAALGDTLDLRRTQATRTPSHHGTSTHEVSSVIRKATFGRCDGLLADDLASLWDVPALDVAKITDADTVGEAGIGTDQEQMAVDLTPTRAPVVSEIQAPEEIGRSDEPTVVEMPDAPEIEIPEMPEIPDIVERESMMGPDRLASVSVTLSDVALTQPRVEGGSPVEREGHLNSRTIKMRELLQKHFSSNPTMNFTEVSQRQSADRTVAARTFYELLILSNRKYIEISQDQPYGHIIVSPTERFGQIESEAS